MSEKMPASTPGESINHSVEDLSTAQDFTDKIESIRDQIQLLVEQKSELKLNRDNNEKMNPAVFKRYGGESVYQDHLIELNDKISDFESQIQDIQQLYQSLGGDKIDSLKSELLERTGGKPRVTWSAEAMITARALEQAERAFEDSYQAYIDSQEPDPTGNQGQGKQPAGGSGTKEPVTARGIAKKLMAEGKEFSLDALQEAIDHEADQSQTAPVKESFLSKIKDGAKNFVKGTGEIIKHIWSPAIYWASLTRGAIEKVNNIRPEDFSSDKDYRREKRKAVISAIGPFAIGGLLVTVGTSAVKTGLFLSPAARVAGLVANEMGDDVGLDAMMSDHIQSSDIDTTSHGDFSPMGWGNYDGDMSSQAGIDTGDAGVVFDQDPLIDVGSHGYDISLDPFFAPDKGPEWNMSNGFITNGTPAEAMDDWMKDLFKSPEMMSMFAAESGMEGADDPTTLDDLLTNSANDYISWSDRIKEMLDQATDVHYETIPAGKEYNTWYTQIDNNGDPQLVQSFDISHDKDVTALVFSIKGENYMVNSDCGQLVRYEPTVYANVPIFNPSDQPSGTPPSPSSEPGPGPGPSPEPEPEPGHEPEPEPEPEPAPKDSSASIDENSEVPEGNKADAVEADSATGGDTEPSEKPGATYTPPAQAEGAGQVASDAQAPQSEQRQAQADQGVDTGDGNQSNSGTVSTN